MSCFIDVAQVHHRLDMHMFVIRKYRIGIYLISMLAIIATRAEQIAEKPSLASLVSQWGQLVGNGQVTTQSSRLSAETLIDSLAQATKINVHELQEGLMNSGAARPADFVYAKKLSLPANSNAYSWGDLHGDIASLAISLQHLVNLGVMDDTLKIVKPNTYFIFDGDYVDRGNYGAEVLYLLTQLKIANPQHVLLVRGNHEDLDLNYHYGFTHELQNKYPAHIMQLTSTLQSFFGSLPAAGYTGIPSSTTPQATNYMLFCHGGFELGHEIRPLLADAKNNQIIEQLARKKHFEIFKKNDASSRYRSRGFSKLFDNKKIRSQALERFMEQTAANPSIGYMWSDFTVGNVNGRLQKLSYYNSGRGIMYGDRLVEYICRANNLYHPQHRLVGIVRGHQHNDSMPKLATEDNQSVYKLTLHPEHTTPYYVGSTLVTPSPVHVITTVATAAYTPSPSLLHINFSGDPDSWVITNYFIPHFAEFSKDPSNRSDFLKKLTTSSGSTLWQFKQARLVEWKNEIE